MPFPRWGLLDEIYKPKDSISARIRLRLGALGEIAPVMYDTANHNRILFKIGNRVYYCKSPKRLIDDFEEDDDFEEHPYADILGLLPISYSQLLESDAQAIMELISDYWIQRNLHSSDSTVCDRDCLDRSWMLATVKTALIRYCGKYPGDEILKTWTTEEWKAMRRLSVGLDGGYIPSCCQIDPGSEVTECSISS